MVPAGRRRVFTGLALCSLDGLAQKVLDLRMKQYWDKSKEQQVIDKRVQKGKVTATCSVTLR